VSGFEIAIVVAAIVAGSFVKAVTGMGLPLIAIPIMALFIDVETAVVTMALPSTLSNAFLAQREVKHYPETRHLMPLIGFGTVGAIAGTLLLSVLPDKALLASLAAAVCAYLIKSVLKPDFVISEPTSKRWTPFVGTVAGIFQGAVGISGPIVVTWIHSFRLTRGAHILSVTSIFLLGGLAQLIIFIIDGRIFEPGWVVLAAVIPMVITLPFGTRFRDRLSGPIFDLAIRASLAASAIALLVRAFA
jgi:uncharacterized membrane protein YfcA